MLDQKKCKEFYDLHQQNTNTIHFAVHKKYEKVPVPNKPDEFSYRGVGRAVGKVVAFLNNQNQICIGWSMCKKVDRFEKYSALYIAINRAANVLKDVPHTMLPFVEAMNERASRYFKDGLPFGGATEVARKVLPKIEKSEKNTKVVVISAGDLANMGLDEIDFGGAVHEVKKGEGWGKKLLSLLGL